MRLGIFAKTFPGQTASEVLSAVTHAGFDCAQYNLACSGLASMPDEVDPAIIEEVKATQVEIVALSGTFNMIHPDAQVRGDGLRRLHVVARAARAMGAPLVTLCTGTRHSRDMWHDHPDNNSMEAWRDLLAAMAEAVHIAEQNNVELGIEPELANVVNSARRAKALIDEMQSDRIRIVFDPANLFEVETRERQRQIVSEGLTLLGDRIAICHAKDRLANGDFAAAGQGVLDYGHFIRELRNIGFDGAMVAHGLQANEAASVATFLWQRLQKS
jgi:sugar phosphate isomerase/epimerase